MLYATPPLAIFLTLLGFSPAIANWLKSISPHLLGSVSAAGMTLALISIFNIGYKFCDIFPQSVYYYLWPDVIPQQLMGTFACLFRVVSTAGTFVFNKYVLHYCDDYPAAVCSGAAGLYLVSFLLLCWQVKEGQYPPPEPIPDRADIPGVLDRVWRFVRESYSVGFYWKYFLFNLCFNVGFAPFRDFLLFYAQKDLKMDLAAYGNVMAMRDAVQIGVYLCIGPIIDRLHPLRASLAGYVLVFLAALGSYFFIHSAGSFGVWIVITFAMVAVFLGASTALGPRLLPIAKYGQFGAASAVVFHLGQMLFTPVLGMLTDRFGNVMVFPWFFGFSAAGILMLYLVYIDWRRRGGDESYSPPM